MISQYYTHQITSDESESHESTDASLKSGAGFTSQVNFGKSRVDCRTNIWPELDTLHVLQLDSGNENDST